MGGKEPPVVRGQGEPQAAEAGKNELVKKEEGGRTIVRMKRGEDGGGKPKTNPRPSNRKKRA